MEQKRCPQCEQVKPLDAYYRDKRRDDGRDFYCKECRDGRGAALRARRAAERPPTPKRTEKRCRWCEQIKPRNEFYSAGGGKVSSVCRRCNTEYMREYRNRPGVRERIAQQERVRFGEKRKRPPRREPAGPGLEVCTACNLDKPFSEFSNHRLGRNGLNNVCRECSGALSRARRANPDYLLRERDRTLARRFGLRIGEYDERLEAQGGVCAICKDGPRDKRRLHVDHCHSTGAVRGLLCNTCNAGLGSFRDDPALMRAAIAYLAKE